MNSRRRYSTFVCFIYRLEEKNSKSNVIFAVCRLPLTSCLTSLLLFKDRERAGMSMCQSWTVAVFFFFFFFCTVAVFFVPVPGTGEFAWLKKQDIIIKYVLVENRDL